MHQVIVDRAVSSNPLIVCNKLFRVDDPFVEKPVAWFAQAEIENCPRIKFQVKMHILFLKFPSSSLF